MKNTLPSTPINNRFLHSFTAEYILYVLWVRLLFPHTQSRSVIRFKEIKKMFRAANSQNLTLINIQNVVYTCRIEESFGTLFCFILEATL